VVHVDGRRIDVERRRSDHRLVIIVDLRGRRRGTYHVEIIAHLRNGRRERWARAYRTCTTTLPPSNRLGDPHAL
jgi:hypothetical protein